MRGEVGPSSSRLPVDSAPPNVHVMVGPVPSASVSAFVCYARTVLGSGTGTDLATDVVRSFHTHLTEWEALSEAGREVVWETDASPEVAEYLVLAFYRVAQRLQDDAGRTGPALPLEAEAFYRRLVSGLLDGLADGGPPGAEFAEYLRSFWPGGALD